jgi:hypothetical protein
VGVQRLWHLVAVGRLAYHRDAVRAVEHHRQPRAYEWIVVNDQHPDRHAGHGSRARSRNPSALSSWSSVPPASSTRSARPIRPSPQPPAPAGVRAGRVADLDRPGAGGRPRPLIWTVIAAAVLALSLLGPLGGVSSGAVLGLLCLHLVVGLVLIAGLPRPATR